MTKKQLVVLAAIAALSLFQSQTQASDLRLHFIAVGHGDAILIEQDHLAIALVDAGPPDCAAVVLDYLHDCGFYSLEHLFITHTHDDHIGGVPLLLDSMEIGQIHLTGMIEEREAVERLDQRLRSGAWRVDTLGAGDIPIQREKLTIEVLSPIEAETASRKVNPNGFSLVLLVRHDSVQVLLTADIDRVREDWLIQRYGPKLRSQGLKASHHASASGNSEAFLRAINPDIVVVTVGPSQWGYPSAETMERLHRLSPMVLRTDSVGSVILQSNGRKLQVLSAQRD